MINIITTPFITRGYWIIVSNDTYINSTGYWLSLPEQKEAFFDILENGNNDYLCGREYKGACYETT